MATTRLMKLHIGKSNGKSKTMLQSMKSSYDYGKNPVKTQGGELIATYMCDPETADAEFLLSKAKYKAITGREQKRDANVLRNTSVICTRRNRPGNRAKNRLRLSDALDQRQPRIFCGIAY